MKILFVYPNSYLTTSIPLGIAYMSAILKEAGHQVECFDTTFYNTGEAQNIKKQKLGQTGNQVDYSLFDGAIKEGNMLISDFEAHIERFDPDLIAFSIVEESWELAKQLLKISKHFRAKVVVGGVFPTFTEEKIEEAFPTMGGCDYIEVCIGEGEEWILTTVNAMQGKMVKPIRKLTDINTIPFPDYDIFNPLMQYRPMGGHNMKSGLKKTLMIETQRGCPYNCNFCNSKAQKDLYSKGFYRRKSIERIDEELNYLINKHNPEFVYWVGDSFLSMPQKEWEQFKSMYMKYSLPFWMNTRPETITRSRVKDLEEMGCIRCNMGIEHGNEDFRRKMVNRNISNERIIEAAKCFEDCNIHLVVNNIIGYPSETVEQLQCTIDLCKEMKPYIDSASAFIFTPYHGTQLRDYAIQKGYLDKDVVCSNIWSGSLLKNQPISGEKLNDIQRNFNESIMADNTKY